MKKLLLTTVVFLSAISLLSAQFGFKAGMNVDNIKCTFEGVNVDTKSIIGYHAGITGDAQIVGPVYLNVSALYSMKGFEEAGAKYHINYVEIPVNFSFKYDIGFNKAFIQAGPYLGIGVSANYTSGGDKFKINFGDNYDELNMIDYGITTGLGFQFEKIQLSGNYSLGLADMGYAGAERKNRVLSFSVAYIF
jgi:hypothetical protein